MNPLNIVIIGGVAGGASAGAKARRMNEYAKITIFEKGPYISYANCGLPYYISGEIAEKEKLILQNPDSFKKRFNIDVCVNHEVKFIDKEKKTVNVRNLKTSEDITVPYDTLILSPGAISVVPPIPGLDATNIFTLRTVPEAEKLLNYIEENKPQEAIVLGGGYIGIETAEALRHRGMKVTIVEMLPQVLTFLDPDMVAFIHRHIKESGVNLYLDNAVKEIIKDENGKVKEIILAKGNVLRADLVIASLGVKPNSQLAKEAGLEIGATGAIKVNERMETSHPEIYAAGDAVESYNLVTGKWTWGALAGPANKQGRVAGANAAGGNLIFKGILGTAIVRFNKIVAAKTGLSENEAKNEGLDYFVVTTHSHSHVEYYPGSTMLHIKIVVDKKTRKFLGAQVTGQDSVDKTIDVFSTALYFGATVEDLINLDLAYAPPFGAAKSPANIAGMTGQNRLLGLEDSISFNEFFENKNKYKLLDVRELKEYKSGSIIDAELKPIDEFRDTIDEIPKDKPVAVYCKGGYRGYLAQRILNQNGFEVRNLDGGFLTGEMLTKS
ncbi:MAG TPA: FAD-dependent oxidoreductase [Candidatus Eremiobacteraeota bacterium]|nr:MAG: Coenzyme A disulfide reductase [bacterium ADurb.Bin363]HPZ09500.1 FAD-dependent oxidoreductase [Candidatus Eremiobacteraeota bacterium]